jgi:hypothetical protein
MGLFAAIALGLSAAASAFGSVKKGRAADQAARANAETYEQNARFTLAELPLVSEQASMERRRLAERYHAIVGDFVARTAASGLDPNAGSAAYAANDARRSYDLDRRIIVRNERQKLREKDIEAYNYRRKAAVTRMEGKAAKTAGYLEGASTLLTGAAQVSNSLPRG